MAGISRPDRNPPTAAGGGGGGGTVDSVVAGSGIDVDATDPANPVVSVGTGEVTLAMMANLAQDQFIVRTTASTGVPQTATCTAAARTVLDDTTTDAMLTTLGGAAYTGSGGVVRATSPTLVTPALGTPASGTLTNCTGLPQSGTVGLTTADSPQFAAVNVGAATDTTVSRSAAGKIAVEGKAVPLMSGASDLVIAGPTAARTWTGPDSDQTLLYSGGALGTPASGTLTNCTGGSADKAAVPLSSKSADYTGVLGDANTTILHPASDTNNRTFTIPANASVAYPVGTMLTFINEVNTVTIAITTDTMKLAGAGTTGSRTLAANGIATATKTTSTTWIISGTGLT